MDFKFDGEWVKVKVGDFVCMFKGILYGYFNKLDKFCWVLFWVLLVGKLKEFFDEFYEMIDVEVVVCVLVEYDVDFLFFEVND